MDKFLHCQTSLQLCNKLSINGYSSDEIQIAYKAYIFAINHITGWYRGSSKPLCAHLIGVASLLIDESSTINEIIAGLLHAVPVDGEFLFTKSPFSLIEEKFGQTTSTLVARYWSIQYSYDDIFWSKIKASNPDADSLLFSVVKIRIANEIEDYTDNALWFYSNNAYKGRDWRITYLEQMYPWLVEHCERTNLKYFLHKLKEIRLGLESPMPFKIQSEPTITNGKMFFIKPFTRARTSRRKFMDLLTRRYRNIRFKKF